MGANFILSPNLKVSISRLKVKAKFVFPETVSTFARFAWFKKTRLHDSLKRRLVLFLAAKIKIENLRLTSVIEIFILFEADFILLGREKLKSNKAYIMK